MVLQHDLELRQGDFIEAKELGFRGGRQDQPGIAIPPHPELVAPLVGQPDHYCQQLPSPLPLVVMAGDGWREDFRQPPLRAQALSNLDVPARKDRFDQLRDQQRRDFLIGSKTLQTGQKREFAKIVEQSGQMGLSGQ